jgi:16S rRNA A1518/A1519 N6-dimethyltransferase RsmA/KsgA/DIM1 with predicted DNA glycosylase/AP lyase activity
VTDIGAGTGKLTKLLCRNGLIVNAIEPNKNMSFYGKKNTNFCDNFFY